MKVKTGLLAYARAIADAAVSSDRTAADISAARLVDKHVRPILEENDELRRRLKEGAKMLPGDAAKKLIEAVCSDTDCIGAGDLRHVKRALALESYARTHFGPGLAKRSLYRPESSGLTNGRLYRAVEDPAFLDFILVEVENDPVRTELRRLGDEVAKLGERRTEPPDDGDGPGYKPPDGGDELGPGYSAEPETINGFADFAEWRDECEAGKPPEAVYVGGYIYRKEGAGS